MKKGRRYNSNSSKELQLMARYAKRYICVDCDRFHNDEEQLLCLDCFMALYDAEIVQRYHYPSESEIRRELDENEN